MFTFERLWDQSHAMRLTSFVPVEQLVSVDWNQTDWVYPQVAGKNKWFGSLQFYDALNGTYCLPPSLCQHIAAHASGSTPFSVPITKWKL